MVLRRQAASQGPSGSSPPELNLPCLGISHRTARSQPETHGPCTDWTHVLDRSPCFRAGEEAGARWISVTGEGSTWEEYGSGVQWPGTPQSTLYLRPLSHP